MTSFAAAGQMGAWAAPEAARNRQSKRLPSEQLQAKMAREVAQSDNDNILAESSLASNGAAKIWVAEYGRSKLMSAIVKRITAF